MAIFETELLEYPQNCSREKALDLYNNDVIPKIQKMLSDAGIESRYINMAEDGSQVGVYDEKIISKYSLPEWFGEKVTLNNTLVNRINNMGIMFDSYGYRYTGSATTILIFTIKNFEIAVLCNQLWMIDRGYNDSAGVVSILSKYVGNDTNIKNQLYKDSYCMYCSSEPPREGITGSNIFNPRIRDITKLRLILNSDNFILQGLIAKKQEDMSKLHLMFNFGTLNLSNGEKLLIGPGVRSGKPFMEGIDDKLSAIYMLDSYKLFSDIVGERYVGKIPLYSLSIGEKTWGVIADIKDLYNLNPDFYKTINKQEDIYGIYIIDGIPFVRIDPYYLGKGYAVNDKSNDQFKNSYIYLMKGE